MLVGDCKLATVKSFFKKADVSRVRPSSEQTTKGWCLKHQHLSSLWWPINAINTVDNIKLPRYTGVYPWVKVSIGMIIQVFLITFLLNIVPILNREILSWSLMGVKGSICLPIHNKKVNQQVCTNNFLSISFSLLNQSINFLRWKNWRFKFKQISELTTIVPSFPWSRWNFNICLKGKSHTTSLFNTKKGSSSTVRWSLARAKGPAEMKNSD